MSKVYIFTSKSAMNYDDTVMECEKANVCQYDMCDGECKKREEQELNSKEVALVLSEWWDNTSAEAHKIFFNSTNLIEVFTTYSLDEIMERIASYENSNITVGDELVFRELPDKSFIYLGDWIGNLVLKDVESGEILMSCAETLEVDLTGRRFKLTLDDKDRRKRIEN